MGKETAKHSAMVLTEHSTPPNPLEEGLGGKHPSALREGPEEAGRQVFLEWGLELRGEFVQTSRDTGPCLGLHTCYPLCLESFQALANTFST